MTTISLSIHPYLAAYDSIMPDPEGFLACLKKPLPQTMHVNTLKASPDFVKHELAYHGIQAEPMTWHPAGLRVEQQSISIGKLWTYQAGLYQTQEEVSLIPATCLDPQPGERILDLCAAPGGKTVQMAVMMKNTGTIIANDRSYQRIRAVGHMLKRLGITNVITTTVDGMCFPSCREFFDRILVDAPCSCEGTLRKRKRQGLTEPNRHSSLSMSRIQLALLRQAVSRVKPGGRIVYSTCTLAPEENERVIHQLLQEYKGELRLTPISLPGLVHSPGITQWQGEDFDSSLSRCLRLWPQQNNSGGFFVAVLEKNGSQKTTTPDLRPILALSDPSIEPIITPIQERFGISDEALASLSALKNDNRGIYFLSHDTIIPEAITPDSAGLFSIKTDLKHHKLSTAAAMMLSQHATKHSIELSREQRDAYLTREDIALTDSQREQCGDTGYVMVSYAGIGLGLALYLSYRNQCQSLFPKSL